MKFKTAIFIIICSIAGMVTMVLAKEMQSIATCQSSYAGFEAMQDFTETGDIASHTGNIDEAIQAYTCALNIEASYEAAYYGRAMAYQEQGKYELAIDNLLMALDCAGHYSRPEYYLNLAMSYDAMGKETQALEYYTHYLEVADSHDTWVSERVDELS